MYDAAVLFRIKFAGAAIGEDPDKAGYLLRGPESNGTFVSGELVELDWYHVYSGGSGTRCALRMSQNSELVAAEPVGLGHRPGPVTAPQEQGAADGVRFKYPIEDGNPDGDAVTLAMAVRENEGQWPEVAPHWVNLSPPEPDLAVIGQRSQPAGVVANDEFENGEVRMAISAPPSDFSDRIDTPDGTNMKTYLNRQIFRIRSVC